jgi:hypothetical protein
MIEMKLSKDDPNLWHIMPFIVRSLAANTDLKQFNPD